jgi:hypothetical protein
MSIYGYNQFTANYICVSVIGGIIEKSHTDNSEVFG